MDQGVTKSAISCIPSEIWLRIASLVVEQSSPKPSEPVSTMLAPPRSYMDLPSNLAPGSAPLTPLGPVSTGAEAVDGSWTEDYFGTRRPSATSSSLQGVTPDLFRYRGSEPHSIGSHTPAYDRSNSAQPDNQGDIKRMFTPTDVLTTISMVCKELRTTIWPLLIGRLRLSLAALANASGSRSEDTSNQIAAWTGRVRDLELAVHPFDDFLAESASTLFERVGSSLETLTIHFNSARATREEDGQIKATAARQICNTPNGIYFPGLAHPWAGRDFEQPLFPRLKSLRIESELDGHDEHKVGNLHALVYHCPGLLELKIQGAKMDLATYVAMLDGFQSMQPIRLETLQLDLVHQYTTEADMPSIAKEETIELALDQMVRQGRALSSLRNLSIVAFGGLLQMKAPAMITFTNALKRNYPLLQRLELPIRPEGEDPYPECMTVAETIISQASTKGSDIGRRLRDDTVPGLADLRYLSFKCYVFLERLMQFGTSTRNQTESVGQSEGVRPDDSIAQAGRKPPLRERVIVWEASIRPATSETGRSTITWKIRP